MFKPPLCYSEIDSTNDEARRLIIKGSGEGTVVSVDTQTKGRGKPGSNWFSPPAVGVYLSAIVKPFKNPKDLAPITLIGAKAVVDIIQSLTKLKAEIKLPNDVFLNGKKISGILVERVVSGHLIIGIGFNVNNPVGSFPQELANISTSLKIETGRDYDRQKVMVALVAQLDKEYLAYLAKV